MTKESTQEQVLQQATEAMKAATELKTLIEGKAKKLDAIDLDAIEKMSTAITEAADVGQKLRQTVEAKEKELADLAAELKTLSTQTDADQKRIATLEAAIQRGGIAANGDGNEQKAKEKWNKAFNAFARKQASAPLEFHDFLDASAEYKDLAVNSNPDGGYLVTPAYGPVIQGRVFETTPMRSLASTITIGTDRLILPLDDDEASFGWVGETEARGDTNTPTIKEIEIPVQELFAQPVATQKMLDDAVVDIEAWLLGKVADKFARGENNGFVSGTGVKSPRGILTYAAWSSQGVYQANALERVKSGSNGAFTYNGLADLQNSLKEEYQSGAVFLGRRATFGALLKLVDLEGRPIFNTMFDKNTGLSTAVMGKPFTFADDMPAVNTDALALAYGNFREGYTIVDRAGVRILRDPFTKKGFVKFYATKRVGGGVVNFEAIKLQNLTL